MDTVDGMRTFIAVARQQSFTGGAQQLGMSTKLASKYVRQLEERLGAQLFNRTTRSVTLTETGRAYFDRCLALLDQFDEMESLVQKSQAELAGPIRLTAPTGFGSRELVKALQPFQQQHPKVNVDMHLSDQVLAVVEEGFDIAIRLGQLQDSSLMARKLMEMRVVVVASPIYLEKHGKPTHPKALGTHNCLLRTSATDYNHWHFQIENKVESFRVSGTFQTNSPRALANMASGGLGIAMCPHYAAIPLLATGQLELLFEDLEASTIGVYAVYPPNRHLTTRIRALIDHLADFYH